MIARIATPATRDTLANGTLIGAGLGLGIAIVILNAIASDDGYVLPSAKVAGPLVLSSAGGVIGMLIDRHRTNGERVLYVAGTSQDDR